MAERYHWTCPYCDRDTTLGFGDFDAFSSSLTIDNSEGGNKLFKGLFVVCPNPDCKKIVLTASFHDAVKRGYDWHSVKQLNTWSLLPNSKARPFPTYIPEPIIKDYNEACLIRDLSPKASATLARRCLQGIIRDFWGIKKDTLNLEINELKTKIDELTWKAIDGVRSVGNIGAHMEKDINLIVEVEPVEAERLIKLIEILLKEWYINRHEREETLMAVVGTADEKKQARKGTTVAGDEASEATTTESQRTTDN